MSLEDPKYDDFGFPYIPVGADLPIKENGRLPKPRDSVLQKPQ